MLLSSSSGFSRWTPCKTRLFLVPTNIVEEWQTLCLGDLASLPVTVTNRPDKTIEDRRFALAHGSRRLFTMWGSHSSKREQITHIPIRSREQWTSMHTRVPCPLSLSFRPGTMKCAGHIHSESSHLQGPSWEPLTGLLSGQHSSDNSPLIPPPQAILHCVNLTATH